MKATIWHNPGCGTSRTTLAILGETPDLEVEVIEYLNHPPTREKLASLYASAGVTPREGLRTRKGPSADLCEQLGLATAGNDAILDAMVAHPAIIERPLVETANGARLCRPPERVRDIL